MRFANGKKIVGKSFTYRLGGQPVVVQEIAHVLESTWIENIHHWTGDDALGHEGKDKDLRPEQWSKRQIAAVLY
jgi:hypothetical protein